METAEKVRDLSFHFAIEIITNIKSFRIQENEFIISNQLLKSGTAVGALIREAEFAQSRLDFINKMSIALKEANETVYWLQILIRTYSIHKEKFEVLLSKANILLRILVSIVKKAKANIVKK